MRILIYVLLFNLDDIGFGIHEHRLRSGHDSYVGIFDILYGSIVDTVVDIVLLVLALGISLRLLSFFILPVFFPIHFLFFRVVSSVLFLVFLSVRLKCFICGRYLEQIDC